MQKVKHSFFQHCPVMTRYASNTAVAPRQTGPGTNTHRCTTRHGCPDTAVPTRHGQHDTANTANKTNTADTAPGNQYKRKANNENTTTTSTKRSTSGTQRPRHGLHGPDHGTTRLDTQAVANRSVKGIGDTIGLLTLTRFFLHGAMLSVGRNHEVTITKPKLRYGVGGMWRQPL